MTRSDKRVHLRVAVPTTESVIAVIYRQGLDSGRIIRTNRRSESSPRSMGSSEARDVGKSLCGSNPSLYTLL